VAHRSTTIPGFPNFFVIFGPYSPIGNYSAFSVAEVQVGHVLRTIDHMESLGQDLIEPTEEATERLVNKMNQAMKKTVWMSGCKSWYQDANGNIPMWPWTFERYEREMSKLNEGDFRTARRNPQEQPSRLFEFQVSDVGPSRFATPAQRPGNVRPVAQNAP
jgi:hypothetical protein